MENKQFNDYSDFGFWLQDALKATSCVDDHDYLMCDETLEECSEENEAKFLTALEVCKRDALIKPLAWATDTLPISDYYSEEDDSSSELLPPPSTSTTVTATTTTTPVDSLTPMSSDDDDDADTEGLIIDDLSLNEFINNWEWYDFVESSVTGIRQYLNNENTNPEIRQGITNILTDIWDISPEIKLEKIASLLGMKYKVNRDRNKVRIEIEYEDTNFMDVDKKNSIDHKVNEFQTQLVNILASATGCKLNSRLE